MRELDRAAIEEWKIPSTELMERAAEGVAEAVLKELKGRPGKSAASIFCGTGNNGGDGIAAARLLARSGMQVRVFLVGGYEKMTEDAKEMTRRLSDAGVNLEQWRPDAELCQFVRRSQVIVDALFGVGLSRPIRDPVLVELVERINRAEALVVSADIASGVEADTGRILGTAVHADRTVAFTMPKAGHFAGEGKLCTGRLQIWDIGIPPALIRQGTYWTQSIDADYVSAVLPRRKPDGHKGAFGKASLIAGSVGYTGAPVLAAKAAVRTGCGLVTLGVPESIYAITAGKCDEPMPYPLPDTKGQFSKKALQSFRQRASGSDAVLIGPGVGRAPEAAWLMRSLLEELSVPVVVDADGINALEGHIDVLDRRKGRVTVLTPHDGEFARVGGDLSGGDRLGTAREFARAHGCYLVLKGHATVIASPEGTALINTTGNSGMAKGGSGDVLAGMIVSLLAQGAGPMAAAAAAVWLHGRAGDLAAQALTEYAMTPQDMIGRISAAFQSIRI
nr:NAD(P)H-hydrate dehydratase [Dysosmobacter acutus]